MRTVSGVRPPQRAFALAIVARPDLKDSRAHHDPTLILLIHHPAPPRPMTSHLLKVIRLELLYHPYLFPVQVRRLLRIQMCYMRESIVR